MSDIVISHVKREVHKMTRLHSHPTYSEEHSYHSNDALYTQRRRLRSFDLLEWLSEEELLHASRNVQGS